MTPSQAHRIRTILPIVTLLIVFVSSASRAGDNADATASLSWSATDPDETDLAAPTGIHRLYLHIERVAGLDFSGGEVDVVWNPPDDGVTNCYRRTAVDYPRRSGTSCTYLNDGAIVPLVTANEPGHFHVAWANDVTTTGCTSGVILTLDFDFSDCLDVPGCISLSSLSLLDHQRLIDVPSFANANATVLGGAECVANHLPVVLPIGPQTIGVHSTLSVQASAVDVDGDRVLWSGINLPAGGYLTRGTGLFLWTPVAGQQGTYDNVTIVGDDQRGGVDSTTFSITVTNRAPVLGELGSYESVPGGQLAFDLSGSDPDGDLLAFSSPDLPAGATLDGVRFTWTPTLGDVGTRVVTFVASDPFAATDSEAVSINVLRGQAWLVDAASPCTSCDGLSWATAVHTVAEGIALSRSNRGDSVLVAEGTYAGEPVLTPKAYSSLVGGFSHGGAVRDTDLHPTVLTASASNVAISAYDTNGITVDGFRIMRETSVAGVTLTACDTCTIRDVWYTKSQNDEGLWLAGANCLMERCVVAFNSLDAAHIAVYVSGVNMTVRDCTIAFNASTTQSSTAGLLVDTGSSPVSITNTIVWSLRTAKPPINDLSGNAVVAYSDVQGGYPGTGNIAASPLFCDPRQARLGLRPGSPCIGAGEGGTTIGAYDVVCGATEPPRVLGAPSVALVLPTVTPSVTARAHTIAFSLPREEHVTVRVLDATGAIRATLQDGMLPPGEHTIAWDGTDTRGRVPAGVYLLRWEAPDEGQRRDLRVVRLAGP